MIWNGNIFGSTPLTLREMAQCAMQASKDADPRYTALVIRLSQRTGMSYMEVQLALLRLLSA